LSYSSQAGAHGTALLRTICILLSVAVLRVNI